MLVCRVFPTCVGVNRQDDGQVMDIYGIPHVCGGEPELEIEAIQANLYSPRVWG